MPFDTDTKQEPSSVALRALAARAPVGQAVALVVKRRAFGVGLDPTLYAGHSLRAGLATSAAAAGASEHTIMSQTGHRSTEMVRRYTREGSLFRENAAALVGLWRIVYKAVTPVRRSRPGQVSRRFTARSRSRLEIREPYFEP